MTKIKYVSWLPDKVLGFAPFPCRIYLNRKIFNWPTWDYDNLVVHEMTHIKQMKREGYFSWLFRYFLDGWWRWEFEAEAYAAQWLQMYPKNVLTYYYIENKVLKLLPLYYSWMPGSKPSVEQAVMMVQAHVRKNG